MMKLSWGSTILPSPVFSRGRRQFPQSRRLLLVLGAAGTTVFLYLLYTSFTLVIPRRSPYPTHLIPPNEYGWKGEGSPIDGPQQFDTMRFYVRDWSLQLGWNNLRYIIEASLLHAHILNRTLILPSFVYARSCEFKLDTCAAFAPMVNRGDTLGWNPWWQNLPPDEQMGWRIPIELMLDIEHLRKTHPVLLVREYLAMHGLNQSIENLTGIWEPQLYHTGMTKLPPHKSQLSLFTVPNEDYDPPDLVLVDVLPVTLNPPSPGGDSTKSDAHKLEEMLRAKAFNYGPTLTYDEARAAIAPNSDDQTFEQILSTMGWEVLYTYQGAVGHEYTKSVVDPIREVAPKETLRGFWDNYGSIQADVLHVAGEIHHDRKPGFLRFTQEAARNSFTNLVLHAMKPVDQVLVVAEHVNQRMRERTGGRSWMGAHMRRKDFIPFGWVLDSSIEGHTQAIKNGLSAGRHVLETLNGSQVYNVPGMELNASRPINQNTLPHQDDPFFLATDERAPEALKYLQSQGALRIDDLLTPEDRQLFGWPVLLTDVVALIDQAVLVHAEFLYATGLSSLTGGVINMRAARGADPRTAVVA